MCIEDAVTKYSITLFDGGKYHDYEGDIGDVILEYKDRDLDGDHKPDVIKREGQHYVFEFTRKGTFTTDDYSASPNEGEVIQFQDIACRNFDEIEIVHFTFVTGGPSAWDTTVYSWQDGEWRAFTVIDKDGEINSSQLQELVAKETGRPYEAGSVRVAAVKMNLLLLDLGSKDGSSQTTDYRTADLHMNFFPQYLVEGDYECSSLNFDMALVRTWPFDVTGDSVELTSGLQRKLNIFPGRTGTSFQSEPNMLWINIPITQMEVFMGKISKAIEKKKKELMWLKIKLGIKVGAIVLLPVIIGIVIHIIKKKAKKHVKSKIQESIRNHAVKRQENDEEPELNDDTID